MRLAEAAETFRELVAVIKSLRTPGTGCPWDLEQDHDTLRPYLIEEAYEVLDALDRKDDRAFQDELGDLLLQVVLHAQVADDRGAFSITEVVRGITAKMIRRHPHVFGNVKVNSADEVRHNWEQIKAAERHGDDARTVPSRALERVPDGLPALLRAQRVGEKAAKLHGDASSHTGILARVRQEFTELETQVPAAAPGGAPAEIARQIPAELRARLDHQLGDLLFSLCQLARWLGLSAEDSLRTATRRFLDRFRPPEKGAAPHD